MERTKKSNPVEDSRLRWKKTGGGSLRLGGKIIKPGEEFLANESDIPVSFRDTIQCLDSKEKQHEKRLAAVKDTELEPEYFVVEAGDGLWNVENELGKVINERPLELEDAEDMKARLEE